MRNMKIKVANEVESKEVQNLFFELGYSWNGNKKIQELSYHVNSSYWLCTKTGMGLFNCIKWGTGHDSGKLITLPELRDLVVLKRNDVEDATHEDKDDHRFKYRLINNHWHVITEENPAWRKDSIDLNEAPLFIKPIEKKEMKEYLEPMPNGDYRYHKDDGFMVGGDWIEIPEGAECLTICQGFMAFWKKGAVFFLNSENGWDRSYETGIDGYIYLHKSKGCVIVWKRESLNDKLASAEQYRQAEVLPFIDDEPKSAWDTQVGGDHYKKYKIQPMLFALENNLNPLQHSILKYIMRHEDKNGKQDLEKAKHYIDLMIAHYYPTE